VSNWAKLLGLLLAWSAGQGNVRQITTIAGLGLRFSGVGLECLGEIYGRTLGGLVVNPRKADTAIVRLATYNSWFAVAKGEQDKGYRECMPAYVKHTGEIFSDHVKH
jgi:hypothetical protein